MIDDEHKDLYPWLLKFANEPSMRTLHVPEAAAVYRFVWDCDIDGKAYMVRFNLFEQGTASLIVKNLYGTGKLGLGNATTVPIGLLETEALLAGLHEMDFWNMQPTIQWMGFDGAFWTLEGLQGSRYHAIQRWSPGDKFWKLGRMMMRMGGIDLSRINC